jgi:hypothetical protein
LKGCIHALDRIYIEFVHPSLFSWARRLMLRKDFRCIYNSPMLIISLTIQKKIGDPSHGSVVEREVRECFMNRCGRVCTDDREEHRTDPATQWFVSETHVGRLLKIVYVEDNEHVYLKSAYPATKVVQEMFNRNAN